MKKSRKETFFKFDGKRFGRVGRNFRIIKVKLSCVQCKVNILRGSKSLNADSIKSPSERVYINKDISFLIREKVRLRDEYKALRSRYPNAEGCSGAGSSGLTLLSVTILFAISFDF